MTRLSKDELVHFLDDLSVNDIYSPDFVARGKQLRGILKLFCFPVECDNRPESQN